MAHLIVEVFGERVASHFDGPPVALDTFDYAGSASAALCANCTVSGLRIPDLW